MSQHCCTHRLVLAGKDAQKTLQSFIEANVANIMKYFKYSAVRKDKFSALLKMANPDGEYRLLVDYHKVRLSDCVQRIWDLLGEIVQFFRVRVMT